MSVLWAGGVLNKNSKDNDPLVTGLLPIQETRVVEALANIETGDSKLCIYNIIKTWRDYGDGPRMNDAAAFEEKIQDNIHRYNWSSTTTTMSVLFSGG